MWLVLRWLLENSLSRTRSLSFMFLLSLSRGSWWGRGNSHQTQSTAGGNGVADSDLSLTSMTRPFAWTTEAEAAFSRLKVLFTTAPVLSQPDLVNGGGKRIGHGVGPVLSQRSAGDQKLHPWAFFSRLTLAERNYDVGALVLEWRYWLEGAA